MNRRIVKNLCIKFIQLLLLISIVPLIGELREISGRIEKLNQKAREIRIRRMINDASLKLIKEFEGFRSRPYKCSAGVWTIGYGTTRYPDGTPVKPQDRSISEDEANKYLLHDVKKKMEPVVKFLAKNNVELNENQMGALISFAYNLGVNTLIGENRSIAKALIENDMSKVASSLLLYNKAKVNGELRKLDGLARRRERERELFLS